MDYEVSSFTFAVLQKNSYRNPRWYWNTMREVAKNEATNDPTTSEETWARKSGTARPVAAS